MFIRAGNLTECPPSKERCPLMEGYEMQCLHELGPRLSVHLGEVSAYGRLKMQCWHVAGTATQCPLRRGVRLLEVKNAVFVDWDHS